MPGVPGIQSYTSVAASNTTWFPENMAPSAVNDGMRQVQADIRKWYDDAEWINLGDTPSRASNTTFKIAADVTTKYPVNSRLKLYDATTLYGVVTAIAYSAPDTTVTVATDTGNLSASLTSFARSIISPSNISIPSTIGRKGANVASATTTDLSTATGDFVDISGTTTIEGLGTIAAGVERQVRFLDALTLTHNGTSLILPGAANITTAANDTAIFRSLGSGNWLCISYKKASGLAVIRTVDITGQAALTTPDGADELLIYDASATTNKKITLVNVINGLTEDTSPDSTNDFVMTYDASATNVKKAKLSNVGSGKFTLIDTQTASTSASLVFNAKFTSNYDHYYFVLDNILLATDATILQCQLGTGGTPTYTTSGYSSGQFMHNYTSTVVTGSNTADSTMPLTSSNATYTFDTAVAYGAINGFIKLFGCDTTSRPAHLIGHTCYTANGTLGIVVVESVGGIAAATWTAIKFFSSSGNITSGKIYMYGVVNA